MLLAPGQRPILVAEPWQVKELTSRHSPGQAGLFGGGGGGGGGGGVGGGVGGGGGVSSE